MTQQQEISQEVARELLAVLTRLVHLRGEGIADDSNTPWPDARAAIARAGAA